MQKRVINFLVYFTCFIVLAGFALADGGLFEEFYVMCEGKSEGAVCYNEADQSQCQTWICRDIPEDDGTEGTRLVCDDYEQNIGQTCTPNVYETGILENEHNFQCFTPTCKRTGNSLISEFTGECLGISEIKEEQACSPNSDEMAIYNSKVSAHNSEFAQGDAIAYDPICVNWFCGISGECFPMAKNVGQECNKPWDECEKWICDNLPFGGNFGSGACARNDAAKVGLHCDTDPNCKCKLDNENVGYCDCDIAPEFPNNSIMLIFLVVLAVVVYFLLKRK
jgi:hypothetical protein